MYIKVRVQAAAKEEKIIKKSDNTFLVWVKEPAERNMANRKVMELVARELTCMPRHIRIVSGHHSPSKILSVELLGK